MTMCISVSVDQHNLCIVVQLTLILIDIQR